VRNIRRDSLSLQANAMSMGTTPFLDQVSSSEFPPPLRIAKNDVGEAENSASVRVGLFFTTRSRKIDNINRSACLYDCKT